VSDGSLNFGQCSHTWVLAIRNIDRITKDTMSTHSNGMMNGGSEDPSSARSELLGQTTMAIIIKTLLMADKIIPHQ
jgi:hypothetical protein